MSSDKTLWSASAEGEGTMAARPRGGSFADLVLASGARLGSTLPRRPSATRAAATSPTDAGQVTRTHSLRLLPTWSLQTTVAAEEVSVVDAAAAVVADDDPVAVAEQTTMRVTHLTQRPCDADLAASQSRCGDGVGRPGPAGQANTGTIRVHPA